MPWKLSGGPSPPAAAFARRRGRKRKQRDTEPNYFRPVAPQIHLEKGGVRKITVQAINSFLHFPFKRQPPLVKASHPAAVSAKKSAASQQLHCGFPVFTAGRSRYFSLAVVLLSSRLTPQGATWRRVAVLLERVRLLHLDC